MNELYDYDNRVRSMIVPRELVKSACFVTTPKQMFYALMSGERACFKNYNEAAKYYLRAAEIFESLYEEGMSDYLFVLKLNNYIVREIAYDYSVLNKRILTAGDMDSFEIDGPLFKKKGVCSAKSKFFSLMCCLCNIKTVLVTGAFKGMQTDTRHAWNKVYLKTPFDDSAKWYNIDVTNNTEHAENQRGGGDYFLVSDSQISRTHYFIDYPETSEYKQINYLATGSYDYPAAR